MRRSTCTKWFAPIDKASLDKWDDYTEAREEMFDRTDSAHAPWTVIKTDDKKRARIAAIQYFLRGLDYPEKDKDAIGRIDPLILGAANGADA